MRKVSTFLGIIIIAVVALVLFGSVFAFEYFVKPPAQTQNTESDSWKTYKNDQYGFEIKYPAFMEAREGYCDTICAPKDEIGFIGNGKEYMKIDMVAAQVKFGNAGETTGSVSLKDFTNGFWMATKESKDSSIPAILGKINDTSIGNKKAYTFSSEKMIVLPFRASALESKTNFLYFDTNDKSKGILYYEEKNSDIADQMLSTFKFIK